MTEKQEKIINQSVKMLTISEDEAGKIKRCAKKFDLSHSA